MLLTLLQDAVQTAPIAEAGNGPGLFEFFAQSGPMARLVLGVLVIFSLVSWAIILGKSLQFHRARSQSDEFLRVFRKSSRFSEVSSAAERLGASPLVGIFQAGYAEIDAQIKAAKGASPGASAAGGSGYKMRSLAALERSLQRAIRVEVTVFTRWTPFLGTTAAATPFIGLFGTVWGIMVAFQQIGVTGSTSIVTVAPGIAEALINTAGGLVAAIPALIGYNYFAHRARDLRNRLEDFALELLNLSERNFT